MSKFIVDENLDLQPFPVMTDRARLAEKLFLRNISMYSNKPELAARWAKDSANIFFDTLENNNE